MIRKTVVTVFELVVLLLAAYTFFFVQIGRRTPYGHLRAILSTQEAQEAAEDIGDAGKKLKDKAVEAIW